MLLSDSLKRHAVAHNADGPKRPGSGGAARGLYVVTGVHNRWETGWLLV